MNPEKKLLVFSNYNLLLNNHWINEDMARQVIRVCGAKSEDTHKWLQNALWKTLRQVAGIDAYERWESINVDQR